MKDFFAHMLGARAFGHPIHVMLVHFPSALFPMAFIFDVIALYLQSQCLACAAFYCLASGIIFGALASLMGAIDYARLPANHHAWNKASLHGLLSIMWLILFAIIFGLKFKYYPAMNFATPLQLILFIVGVVGLIFSNYLGGDLIFRHKLGMDER